MVANGYGTITVTPDSVSGCTPTAVTGAYVNHPSSIQITGARMQNGVVKIYVYNRDSAFTETGGADILYIPQ